jgi:histidinol-phosphate aminotransferase
MNLKPQSYICDLTPYQPGKPIELVARQYGLDPAKIVKLASNENPLGMSPKAKTAVRRALNDAHRYPDQYQLLQKLSAKLGVGPECLVLGNGSNDVLDLTARTFLNHGDEAISAQYAFAVYHIATQSVGARNVVVSAQNFGHDLPAMLCAVTPKTRVIWIANPNNPTGTFVPGTELKTFLEAVPPHIAVVLDEAYGEYLSPEDQYDSVQWLAAHPNLIITRTFSKIYGLAGLRIGYAITSKRIAELMNRVRQPFNGSVLALAAATAALTDVDFVKHSAAVNRTGRKYLIKELQRLGLQCLPAYGNFVTFTPQNTTRVNQQLLEQGIIVRPLAGYDMPNWLRVTVGLASENRRFMRAIKQLSQ